MKLLHTFYYLYVIYNKRIAILRDCYIVVPYCMLYNNCFIGIILMLYNINCGHERHDLYPRRREALYQLIFELLSDKACVTICT